MTWGKIASWGIATAMTAGVGPAVGCVTVTPVRGPGALIMAWFGRQAS